MAVFVLVLVESGRREVNLETGVFVGKSLRGAAVGDSNLKDRRHNINILHTCASCSCTLQKEDRSSISGQSVLLFLMFYLKYTTLA